jgi:hypothetical protein
MNIIMILVGVFFGGWAARGAGAPEGQKPVILTGPIGGIIQFVCIAGGAALVIWGTYGLFAGDDQISN